MQCYVNSLIGSDWSASSNSKIKIFKYDELSSIIVFGSECLGNFLKGVNMKIEMVQFSVALGGDSAFRSWIL